MSEENDGEQRPTEDEAKASQKEKYVAQDYVRTLKWNWDALQPIPVCDLHDDQSDDQSEIVAPQIWQLFTGVKRKLPEIRQYCCDQEHRSDDLNGKQKQVEDCGAASDVENFHCPVPTPDEPAADRQAKKAVVRSINQ